MNYQVLEKLFTETKYNLDKTQFLVHGFKEGFSLEYHGPMIRQSKSWNLPLTVGNKVILWNKIMKEVHLKRVAGPFNEIPFQNYIQSPVGLVPKAGGDQTRLIFHLSYDFGTNESDKSVNYHTPKHLCCTKY